MTTGVGMLAIGILLVVIRSLEAMDHGGPSGERPGVSGEQRRHIIRTHNELRRLEPAADMQYMEWSERLANLSLITANRCIFRPHQSTRGEMTSQNMAIISGRNLSDMTSAVTWWYDDTYDVTNGQCKQSPTCVQHLQLIWASTNEVGCASNKCDLLFNDETNETASNETLFVCTYLPGLSSVNTSRPPFVVGEACSQCASGAIWCDTTEPRGLCRRNCSDEVTECVLIDNLTTDVVPISHQNTGPVNNMTSLENLPSYNTTSAPGTIIGKPNKTTWETDSANQITSTLLDTSITVRPTFTRNEGLPSGYSTRTTRDLRYSTAKSGPGSATRTRSTTFSWATSVKNVDGATDVTKARTEPVFGSFSNTVTQSSTNVGSSTAESTTSSTGLWLSNDARTSAAQSDASREIWPRSDWSRNAASWTTRAAVITSSVSTERLPTKSAITSHTTAYHRMSTSQDSSTQTPTERSWSELNTTPSQSLNVDTTTSGTKSPSLSSDTVNTKNPNRITSHRAVLTTTTTNAIYISDPVEITDTSSTKSSFWLTVILIVSLDSLLLVAIVVTGVVMMKQKRDADRNKQLYEDDTESHMSESKYYHFGFEGFQDEATA